MKLVILPVLLLCCLVGCTQSIEKKDTIEQEASQSLKVEITELLQCKCIDAHIDAIVSRYSPAKNEIPTSPLLMGKLVYNGVFSLFEHKKLLELSDTFYYSAIDHSIKSYKQKSEGVASMTNIFNWCKLKSIDYINLNWPEIQKRYLVKVIHKIEN